MALQVLIRKYFGCRVCWGKNSLINNKQKKVLSAVTGTMKWSGKKDIFSGVLKGGLHFLLIWAYKAAINY
jgi:hypothetical protein